LPVLTAMSCVLGGFEVPGYDGLGETLLLSQTGGAIAVWAPTGLSLNDPAQTLCEGFYSTVFNDKEGILGDGLLKALRIYGDSGRMPYMLNIYNLLGDPGLMVSGLKGAYQGKSVTSGTNGTVSGWSYDEWKWTVFTAEQAADPAISGAAANPSGNGVPNFIEYAFGGNPLAGNWPAALGIAATHGDTNYQVELTYKQRKSASDVNYVLDVSSNLFDWYNSVGYSVVVGITDDGNGETETVTIKARPPGTNISPGYMRLRVNEQ